MNVISLFNGAIPLIALQLSAYKVGNDISLAFTRVIDRVTPGSDEEDVYEITDRNYWENNRSTKKSSKSVLKPQWNTSIFRRHNNGPKRAT